jgi:two-component sensor histidine kinase
LILLKNISTHIKRNIIFFILIATTISVILLFPTIILKNSGVLIADYQELFSADCFELLDNNYYDVVSVRNKAGNLLIEARNLKEGTLNEYENPNLTFRSNMLYNEVDKNVYFIANKQHEYYLFKVFDDDGRFQPTSTHFFSHEAYESLFDYTTEINGKTFCGYSVNDTMNSNFSVSYINDQILINFRKEYYKKLLSEFLPYKPKSKIWESVADTLSMTLKIGIKPSDIFKILLTEMKAGWYKACYKNPERFKNDIIFDAKLLHVVRNHNTNQNALLINITADRHVPETLICFDPVKETVLWQKECAAPVSNSFVADINKDGVDEIIISTYASGYGLQPDWFEKQENGTTMISSLQILNSNGEVTEINGKEAYIEVGGYRTEPYFAVLAEDNVIVYGIRNSKARGYNNLFKFDLKKNTIDTLDITYQYLLDLDYKDGLISMIHRDSLAIERVILDNNLKHKKIYSQKNTNRYEVCKTAKIIEIDKNEYLVMKPLTLLDHKMRNVYDNEKLLLYIDNRKVKHNSLYLINGTNTNKPFLCKLTFSRNKTLSPIFILIIIFELILILMYYYFRQLLFLPFVSGKSSYAVLYRIFGVVYHWRIYGKLSYLKFPKNISVSDDTFFLLLKSISQRYEIESEKKSKILNVTSYKLLSDNDFFIFNDRVHDIIPILGLVSGNLRRYKNYEKDSDLVQQTTKDIGTIQQQLRELLDFSKPMSLTKIDITGLLEVMVFSYSNHNRFDDIVFDDFNKEFIVVTDEPKINIILRNLLHNAVKYSAENTKINITIEQLGTDCVIRIINAGHISDKAVIGKKDKSKGGSGIGLRICTTTIEKLNGKLMIEQTGDFVSATVKLPIK